VSSTVEVTVARCRENRANRHVWQFSKKRKWHVRRENDGPDGAGTSFLLFLQRGDNWLRRIRIKINTLPWAEIGCQKGVGRDRESCWILSWAVTLEISARRRSDKYIWARSKLTRTSLEVLLVQLLQLYQLKIKVSIANCPSWSPCADTYFPPSLLLHLPFIRQVNSSNSLDAQYWR
jgi:hypothetical protein